MLTNIIVLPETQASSIFFFKEMDFTKLSNPQIILLFGPNGIGKSTLIKRIRNYNIRSTDIIVGTDGKQADFYVYTNSTDNMKVREPRSYMESFDPRFVNARFDARHVSEGQSILYSALDLLDSLKPGQNAFQSPNKDTIVLLDEIDSGLSIDNIDIMMRKLKYALSRRDDLQIIMSFNSPRILKHFPEVISMYDGSILTMQTDEDMLAEINKHKKTFDKARKTSKGRPKVFE